MTPVQAEVLQLLPGLSSAHTPGVENKERIDLVLRSATGSGKTAAFLIPALEARQVAIRAHAAATLAKSGLVSGKEAELSAARAYVKTRVGTLVLCPTRESATQVANDAIKLSAFYPGFEVRLLVGGMSRTQQMKDWMKARRDIIVATPGRLRDLLYTEPDVVYALKFTQNVSHLLQLMHR